MDCPANDSVQLPSRIIDVGNDTQAPRLVETEKALGQYLTLSYCWGGVRNGMTLRSNLRGRLSAMTLDSLPQTHRDAIDLTRRLGFQYLWIDALCIVQDDFDEWAAEASRMWQVYRDSTLTISVDSADNAASGIYSARQDDLVAMAIVLLIPVTGVRTNTAKGQATEDDTDGGMEKLSITGNGKENLSDTGDNRQKTQTADESAGDSSQGDRQSRENDEESHKIESARVMAGGITWAGWSEDDVISLCTESQKHIILVRRPVESHELYSYGLGAKNTAAEFPIEDRAWCFQERILSTRIVHFNCDELVWECNSSAQCECGGITSRKHFVGIRERFEVFMQEKGVRARCDAWTNLVEKFYSRKITKSSDRLACLSGLAHALQARGYGEYVAGLWLDHLPSQLLWRVSAVRSRRAAPVRAPTWSYASLETDYVSFILENTMSSSRKDLASVVSMEHALLANGPLGFVSRASITLHGPVQDADLHIRFVQNETSPVEAHAMIRIGGRLEAIVEDLPTVENTSDLVFENDLDTSIKAYEGREPIKRPSMRGFRTEADGTRTPILGGRVLLMALCTEGNFPCNAKFANVLYILVLKARPQTDREATGESYERIGVLEVTGEFYGSDMTAAVKEEDHIPEAWLADSQERSIKIV
jgi:hypothetical protein